MELVALHFDQHALDDLLRAARLNAGCGRCGRDVIGSGDLDFWKSPTGKAAETGPGSSWRSWLHAAVAAEAAIKAAAMDLRICRSRYAVLV